MERGSKYHYKWAIISLPAKRHLNMTFRWRADDCSTLNAGLFRGYGPVLLRNPIFFVIFQRGSGPPVSPLDLPLMLIGYSFSIFRRSLDTNKNLQTKRQMSIGFNPKYLWLRVSIFEKHLAKILDYLVQNNR